MLEELRQIKIEKIPATKFINGVEKSINYIDKDTTNCDLIIKSDSKDYYGLGGSISVYFSITNISDKNQHVKTLCAFGGDDRYYGNVRRVVGEKEVIDDVVDRETKEISKVVFTETVYEQIAVIDKDGIKDEKITPLRKDLKGMHHKKQFTQLIKAGETEYFKTSVVYPVTKGDEFIIEAFGSEGGYGYLDPNLWTYEQKFNTLNDGDLNGQDSWTAHAKFDVTTNAGARYEGAKGVEVTGNAGGITATRSFTNIESGIMYISFKKTDDGNNQPNFFLLNDNNGQTEVNLYFDSSDHKLKYYNKDSASIVQVGTETFEAGTWYRLGIKFRCSGAAAYESLGERQFSVSVNNGDWNGPYPFERTNGTGMSSMRIDAVPSEVSGTYIYFDDISPNYCDPPTVTTQAASSVASSSFIGNGNITATGGANATRRGFAYCPKVVAPSTDWIYEQKFNTLNDGDINGQDSWTGTAGVEVQTTTKYEGAKALQMVHDGIAQNAQREITAIAEGSMYVAMMKTDNNSDESNFQLRAAGGGSIAANIKFSSGGKIQYYASGYVDIISYTANQWYILNIEFDYAVQGTKYRVRVNDGTSWSVFTSWVDAGQGAWTTVGRVHVEKQTGNGHYTYWDIITPQNPVGEDPTTSDSIAYDDGDFGTGAFTKTIDKC